MYISSGTPLHWIEPRGQYNTYDIGDVRLGCTVGLVCFVK